MTDSIIYDYTPDTSEALDIMGADWFSWSSVACLIYITCEYLTM